MRKGLKGKDEALGKIRQVDESGAVLHRSVQGKGENWQERDEVRGVCVRRKARGGY